MRFFLPLLTLLRSPAMGEKYWRDDEFEWLTETQKSDAIQKIYNGKDGSQSKAATELLKLYNARFSELHLGETEAEWKVRRRTQRNARRFVAETEEERVKRLDRAPQVRPLDGFDGTYQVSDIRDGSW